MIARLRRRDSGFTLIELLVTVVILGVITVPLANLVIEYFLTTAKTQARLHESHDSQITAAYFSQDVASIGVRNQTTQALQQSIWTSSVSGAPLACSSGITPFVAFAWDEFDSAGAKKTIVVEYGTRTQIVGGQSETQLVRLHCTNTAVADSTAVVAHDLTATPTVVCSGNGSSSCNDSTNVPASVTMNLSLRDSQNTGAAYTIAVSGQRRQT